MFESSEMKFALQAVRQAASLVRQIQSELVTPALTKDDRSPVTVADFASQAVVAALLAQIFPDDLLVGEEDATALRSTEAAPVLDQVTSFVQRAQPGSSPEQVCAWIDRGHADPLEGGRTAVPQRFWTLDPIDGTKGFLRGDQYAVALALIVDGKVQLGVLGCPNLTGGRQRDLNGPGSVVAAGRGAGTWVADLAGSTGMQRLHVSERTDPAQARLMRSFESGHTNVSQIDEFAAALGIQIEPLRLDSQAKYALLAAGEGELLLRLLSPAKPDYREKIWDQAAGSIVLEEAGGRITDLHGRPLGFARGRTLAGNRGILASNGQLHPAALQALKTIGA